jgi:hypothetical protein
MYCSKLFQCIGEFLTTKVSKANLKRNETTIMEDQENQIERVVYFSEDA